MNADDDKCEDHHTTLFEVVFLPDRQSQHAPSGWLISQGVDSDVFDQRF